jgi:DNA-binding beta-propeller fold protein YncE
MLTRPVSIVAFSPEKFWLLDQGLNTIMQVDEKVGDIPHFISKAPAEFISLVSLCKTPADGLLFTDSGSKKIYRILPEKKKLLTLNDFPDFNQPTGIAYSQITGEIWVVETNSHRIITMNASGEILRRIGSRGTGKGEFNYPTHLWIDKNGLAYVVDAMNFRIQVLDSAGTVVSIFGKQGDASGYFARPKGIATDSHGNIYVVDALFHVVQVFDLDGSFLFSFGAQGSGEGEFWMPSGIFIDDDDYIYVADSYNSRIQIFQTTYVQKP